MKKPIKLKSVVLLSILTVGVFVLILRLSGKSISSPEGSSAETSVSATAQMLLNQSAHIMVSSPVMPSNHLPRATSEELTALRRVFMATFMEQTASSRARGDFIFAGRSINPSTVGKARSFAKQHDADTMGAVSAFMVQLRDNPFSLGSLNIRNEISLLMCL